VASPSSHGPAKAVEPRAGIATSLVMAIANIVFVAGSQVVASKSQEVVPPWVWAVAFIWLVSIGPVLLPIATLVLARRDWIGGLKAQAWGATAIAVATSAATLGRAEVGF